MFGVLVVEDNDVIARLLATCVSENRWLNLAGVAGAEQEAIDMACRLRPDLVLLDFGLSTPMGGFDVWHALHKLDKTPRVIAVTAARDMATVDKACACGAFDYVVKPFTRATVAAKLADYTSYRRSAMAALTSADQTIVDRILKILHRSYPAPPKLLRETLESIITVLRTAEEPLRAEQIARQAGVKRETANRYLKHLYEQGVAQRLTQHEGPGHPWHLYTLAPAWQLPSSTS